MTTLEEIDSVLDQIDVLLKDMYNSRNGAERAELNSNINSLCKRLTGLRDQFLKDAAPCQTPGCDNEAELEPNRCVDCADQEVEHGV